MPAAAIEVFREIFCEFLCGTQVVSQRYLIQDNSKYCSLPLMQVSWNWKYRTSKLTFWDIHPAHFLKILW
jgi:hypothetical protein